MATIEEIFQFPPLREGRRWTPQRRLPPLPISIPAPARGATANFFTPSSTVLFQFPPLREGRRLFPYLCPQTYFYFNSRPCARGDRPRPARRSRRNDFNSRPCARGDIYRKSACALSRISIPAPARGATNSRIFPLPSPYVFQFPPLREGRRNPKEKQQKQAYFNSRPCARGDQRAIQIGPFVHKFQFPPLREGRRWEEYIKLPQEDFNSRPCARGDQAVRQTRCERQPFQFPPLREGRLLPHPYRQQPRHFNSRPCARGDRKGPCCPHRRTYFNSRPCARGDTAALSRPETASSYFNSRPCARGDPHACAVGVFVIDISIPAPARGATQTFIDQFGGNIFQFPPLREGRPYSSVDFCDHVHFNSRPCARGDLVGHVSH